MITLLFSCMCAYSTGKYMFIYTNSHKAKTSIVRIIKTISAVIWNCCYSVFEMYTFEKQIIYSVLHPSFPCFKRQSKHIGISSDQSNFICVDKCRIHFVSFVKYIKKVLLNINKINKIKTSLIIIIF